MLVGSETEFEALPDSPAPLEPLTTGEAAYLQYTSGSTRFPRGVEMTQDVGASTTFSEIRHIGVRVTSEKTGIVSWLPFYHDMGLVGLRAGSRPIARLPSRPTTSVTALRSRCARGFG